MTFEAVFEAFKRTKEHLDKQQTRAPYQFATIKLEKAKELFKLWLELYELYGKGYQSEVTTFSKPNIINALSMFGRGFERKLVDVFQTKISPEVYILVGSLFGELKRNSDHYVIAEGDGFEQRSIYDEIFNQALKNMKPPRKIDAKQYKQLEDSIRDKDVAILYYERGQHDHAICWPLLLHEATHWVYMQEGLSALETKITNEPKWVNEALIDMYVCNLFGPAYATSLAAYLSLYPHEEALSHPNFIVRLYT